MCLKDFFCFVDAYVFEMDGFLTGFLSFYNGDVGFWEFEELAEEFDDFIVCLIIFCWAVDVYVDGMAPGVVVSREKGGVTVWDDMEVDKAALWGGC